jgi:hypothetical protein
MAGGRSRIAAILVAVIMANGLPGASVRAADPGAAEQAVDARLTVSPLLVGLELDAAEAATGVAVKARARVLNAGPTTVRDVVVSLRIDTTSFGVRGNRVTIGQIQAGRTASVAWTLCGRVPGAYLVFAQATLDGVTIESPAALLTILPGSGKRC